MLSLWFSERERKRVTFFWISSELQFTVPPTHSKLKESGNCASKIMLTNFWKTSKICVKFFRIFRAPGLRGSSEIKREATKSFWLIGSLKNFSRSTAYLVNCGNASRNSKVCRFERSLTARKSPEVNQFESRPKLISSKVTRSLSARKSKEVCRLKSPRSFNSKVTKSLPAFETGRLSAKNALSVSILCELWLFSRHLHSQLIESFQIRLIGPSLPRTASQRHPIIGRPAMRRSVLLWILKRPIHFQANYLTISLALYKDSYLFSNPFNNPFNSSSDRRFES